MATKLELNWIGKTDGFALIRDEEGKPYQVPYDDVQPRLLVRAGKYGEAGEQDNILIRGENLFALKTIVKSGYAGQIRCCFIDPPYNTGKAFTHYDDALEHSLWLDMMQDRIELIRDLLAKDGSLWISIDDDEGHYLKVMCDEIFGRSNFVANVIWEKKFSPSNDAKWLSDNHDHIIVYAKDKSIWRPNLLPRSLKQVKNFKNPDNDPRGVWSSGDYTCAKSKAERPNLYYPITNPFTKKEVYPTEIRVWAFDQTTHQNNVENNLVFWGNKGKNSVPRIKKFPEEVRAGTVPTTIWKHEVVGNNQEARREVIAINEKDPFATPKPERLIQRIIQLATNENDRVLDCFAGSGTTGAAALKMNRRFIMIQEGTLCETHIIPRLEKVIDGTDKGGISPLVSPHPSRRIEEENIIGEKKTELGWTGGGGFTYYTLGKSLMERDAETGVWRLNYTNGRMIEAVCLQEGFRLVANGWRHGIRGRHFAHISDQLITQEIIEAFAAELAPEESLTVYCLKSVKGLRLPENVELKRLPRDLSPTRKAKKINEPEAAITTEETI